MQSGKQLTTGEKLNAFPGTITLIMRDLAIHPLFKKVNFSTRRYKPFQLVAQIFLLIEKGITDISATHLDEFFYKNKDGDENSNFYKVAKKILNFMDRIIIDDKLIEMSKPSWFINYFIFSKDILEKYVVIGLENQIFNFFQDFRQCIDKNQNRTTSEIDFDAVKFASENRAGTNNKKSIQYRKDFIVSKFLEWYPDIMTKDFKNKFDEDQRIAIYRKNKGICQNPECGIKVSFNDFHADHIIPYSRGGNTCVNNGQVLCEKCNTQKSNNLDIGY